MKSPTKLKLVILLFLAMMLALAACERPFQDTEVQNTIVDPIVGDNSGEEIEVVDDTSTDAVDDTEDVAVDNDGVGDTAEDGEEGASDENASAGDEATDAAADPNQGGGTPDDAQESGEEAADSSTDAEESASEEDTDANTAVESDSTDASDASNTDNESTQETTDPTTQTGEIEHTVAAGENLYRIGLRYGVSWVTLADYNNLPNANVLVVGQKILIPTNGGNPNPPPTPVPTDGITYTVRAGDTLFRIGLRYGVDWRQIAEANGIVNPNQIRVGQVLKIPTSQPGPTPTFTHEVKQGESLFSISLEYGVRWQDIAAVNKIGYPYYIFPGQELQIPGTAEETDDSESSDS